MSMRGLLIQGHFSINMNDTLAPRYNMNLLSSALPNWLANIETYILSLMDLSHIFRGSDIYLAIRIGFGIMLFAPEPD